MVDSGGSTGRLRDEFGTLPPGDVLKCILALSPHREVVRQILQKRFQADRRLRGHNAGNMLLTMLSRYTGSFPSGIQALAEILNARGAILPVTIDRATLVAELTDGTRIFGERAIDMPRGTQREKIKDVYLVPHHSDRIRVYPPVLDAIKAADFIVIGPGDLYTSIASNLIVPGVAEALQQTRASLVYVLNIMTKFGETHNFDGPDFVSRLENFTGRRVDFVVYNTQCPDEKLLAIYHSQKADFVRVDPENSFWQDRALIPGNFLETSGELIRHNSKKLAKKLDSIFKSKPGK